MQRQPSMGGVFLRAAVAPDLPQIVEMLHGAGLIVAGVEDHLGAFLVAADGERVIGSAGLEVYGDVALLRSVAVDEGVRGQGLGRRLVTAAPANARHLGGGWGGRDWGGVWSPQRWRTPGIWACVRSHSSRPLPRRSSGAWDSARASGRRSILASPRRKNSATSAARRRWS